MTKLEAICTFGAGIAISAFTNLLTNLDAQHASGWRIASMFGFLFSAIVLFLAALQSARVERARQAARSRKGFERFYLVTDLAVLGCLLATAALVLLGISFAIGDP
jgi:uncharacterized membrane protein YidH (DUF202 family)